MPLIVHSTCRAPAATAASAFATAMPRSLWQCAEIDDVLDSLHALPDRRNQIAKLRSAPCTQPCPEYSTSSLPPPPPHPARGKENPDPSASRPPAKIQHHRTSDLANRIASRACSTHCIARDPQLVLQMNIGSRQEHMDPRPRRFLQRLPRALNVRPASPRQPGNNRAPHDCCNRLHRLKIPIRCDREIPPRSHPLPAGRAGAPGAAFPAGSCCSRATARHREAWCRKS